jgi:hypothetical protein
VAAAVQKTELEQLIEALPFAESVEDFASIIEDSPLEAVEDAIASTPSQPRKKQLEGSLEALTKGSEQPSMLAEAESPLPKVGDRVFALNCPHTASMGPFLIEAIEGALAKLEMFSLLIPLAELEIVS